jgi:2-keto-4-pentenoate hydratase
VLSGLVDGDGDTVSLAGNRMCVAEPEFAFRLGRRLAPRAQPYSVAEVLDAVDALLPSSEVPNSRFADFARAGEPEYADEIVTRADVVALRRKVVAVVDDTIDEASADVTAVLRDGRRVHVFVEHAIGSLQRPMSDAALERKFSDQAVPVIGAARTAALVAACWRLGQMADVRELTALATP